MSLPLKLYKSAGVPVTAAVHRFISAANRARDEAAWTTAATNYGRALELDPKLTHIWIQQGHALKEAGDYQASETAYRRAIDLAPDEAEPHLHLGHLKKRMGDMAATGRSYLTAARMAPENADALGELHTLVNRGSEISREALLEILQSPPAASNRSERQVLSRSPDASSRNDAAEVDTTIVFDASDLISYFKNARLPTGIQRVQVETISNALAQSVAGSVKVCCFIEQRDDWLEVPSDLFLNLCRLSLSGGDKKAPEWVTELSRLYIILSTSDVFELPEAAFLVNLGTSWWLQNYFLFVREAKKNRKIRYVPFVHDLIPVVAPEHCTKELTRDFISWAIGAFEHADFFLVNSEATRADLIKVGAALGHSVSPDRIVVIRLDADFHKAGRGAGSKTKLAELGLTSASFVLFVSTIESRKNHIGVFDAWLQLMRTHGTKRVPKLVCVGNRGWLNDAVYARLASHDGLRRHVVMLSGLSDDELATLYRECLFTLYPSHYEGWGLPVTESLCHGKVPLLSDSSSLPEAGGPFAIYFETGSQKQLVKALERLMFDSADRVAQEARIRSEFSPRSWGDIAKQIQDRVDHWRQQEVVTEPVAPAARAGAYYPMTRNFETRIWPGMGSGEVFRAGSGWWWPDDWGCWTKPRGGEIVIGMPRRHGPIRAYFQLHAPPHLDSDFILEAPDLEVIVEGRLRAGEFKWVMLDLPAANAEAPVLRATLRGSEAESLGDNTGGLDSRTVAVGVTGFFLCETSDIVSRFNFLEAVSLGNIVDLSAFRDNTSRNMSVNFVDNLK